MRQSDSAPLKEALQRASMVSPGEALEAVGRHARHGQPSSKGNLNPTPVEMLVGVAATDLATQVSDHRKA